MPYSNTQCNKPVSNISTWKITQNPIFHLGKRNFPSRPLVYCHLHIKWDVEVTGVGGREQAIHQSGNWRASVGFVSLWSPCRSLGASPPLSGPAVPWRGLFCLLPLLLQASTRYSYEGQGILFRSPQNLVFLWFRFLCLLSTACPWVISIRLKET